MPPLLVAFGVFALGYGAVKFLRAAARKAQVDLEAIRQGEPRDLGTLKQDPLTGEYRVEK